jgi:hypothetical protein
MIYQLVIVQKVGIFEVIVYLSLEIINSKLKTKNNFTLINVDICYIFKDFAQRCCSIII